MAEKSIQSELHELIARRDWDRLRKSLRAWPPAEIAEVLPQLDKIERV